MFPVVTTVISQIQEGQGIDSYQWIFIFLILLVIIGCIFAYKKYGYVPKWITGSLGGLIALFTNIKWKKGTSNYELDDIIETAGYSYDPKEDIFYSTLDAWQRNFGYCRLYDEAAAPLGMIIDCEPIYFQYGGRRWLIEIWKGQYDLTTGCEIGVYSTTDSDIEIPDMFKGTFFQCVENEDLLKMSYTLLKNNKVLFKRKDKHWWLTGFKLGEFAEPSELTMFLSITLKDEGMRDAFVGGLMKAGYLRNEIIIKKNTVELKFHKPRTTQPITRKEESDWIIQRKNEILCSKFQELTSGYDNSVDKIKAIKDQAPEIYKEALKIGKTKQLYEVYEKIKDYLD